VEAVLWTARLTSRCSRIASRTAVGRCLTVRVRLCTALAGTPPGRPVIRAATTYAGALLEVLVHAGINSVPRHTHWIEINIPPGVSRECPEPNAFPGWDDENCVVSRAFGDAWLSEHRSAALLAPSVVTRRERNLLINPAHPDFPRIVATAPSPVEWDQRLFTR
jgi:RES domain-containing protein